MRTPSLRVYWPDARSRSGWVDTPNRRRPGAHPVRAGGGASAGAEAERFD
jgi:hypothetical protein